MATVVKDNKKALIKRLHTLRSAIGMTQDQYDAMLWSYRVYSSRDMTVAQLEGACNFLQSLANENKPDPSLVRRRLLAAACQMLEKTVNEWDSWSRDKRMEYAKTVACRAAEMERYDGHGRDNFNKISIERMRSLTYAFSKRSRDMDGVMEAVSEVMKS